MVWLSPTLPRPLQAVRQLPVVRLCAKSAAAGSTASGNFVSRHTPEQDYFSNRTKIFALNIECLPPKESAGEVITSPATVFWIAKNFCNAGLALQMGFEEPQILIRLPHNFGKYVRCCLIVEFSSLVDTSAGSIGNRCKTFRERPHMLFARDCV